MNYAETRSSIKSGDVLAWTHRKWHSWYDFKVQMVRVFEQSEYCHVGVAWVIGSRVIVFEAVSSGVRIAPLSKQLPFYWVPTKATWTADAEEYALNQWGEDYSEWLAVLSYFGREDKQDESIWQCAKYAKGVLSKLGIELPGRATPSAVVRDLQALGHPVYMVQ